MIDLCNLAPLSPGETEELGSKCEQREDVCNKTFHLVLKQLVDSFSDRKSIRNNVAKWFKLFIKQKC